MFCTKPANAISFSAMLGNKSNLFLWTCQGQRSWHLYIKHDAIDVFNLIQFNSIQFIIMSGIFTDYYSKLQKQITNMCIYIV
jgi:hypothetical protein